MRACLLALTLMPLAAQAGETVTVKPQPIPDEVSVQAWVQVNCVVGDDLTAGNCTAVDPKGVTDAQVRKAVKNATGAYMRGAKPGQTITLMIQVEA